MNGPPPWSGPLLHPIYAPLWYAQVPPPPPPPPPVLVYPAPVVPPPPLLGHLVGGAPPLPSAPLVIDRAQGRNLYVAGLSAETLAPQLKAMFTAYGPIESVRSAQPDSSGRRIGFVLFCQAEDAAVARRALHGSVVDGVALTVKYADTRANCIPEESRKLFVRHVPAAASRDDLRHVFGQYGVVTEVVIKEDSSYRGKQEGTHDHMAYVTMAHLDGAKRAVVEAHGLTPWPLLTTASLEVNYAESSRRRDARLHSRGGRPCEEL